MEENKIALMTTAEYIKAREEAIRRLNEARYVDDVFCAVGKTRLAIKDKDEILDQLVGGYEFLKVPLELYFTDNFWRRLKMQSNLRVRRLKIQKLPEEIAADTDF